MNKDNRKPVGQLTLDDYIINEQALYENMARAFDETLQATIDWMQTDEAEEYFAKQAGRLSKFMTESGIRRRWQDIIEERAETGADITEQIYDYARQVQMDNYLEEYTPSEIKALNKLCDYNYELIVNVTEDQISGIRRMLVQDYAEGRNPRRSTLREEYEKIQLEPINHLSPEERAVMIARTESARALNTASLECYRNDGFSRVELYGSSQCDECAQYALGSDDYPDGVPIEEALEIEVPHPNCRCSWIPVGEVQQQ